MEEKFSTGTPETEQQLSMLIREIRELEAKEGKIENIQKKNKEDKTLLAATQKELEEKRAHRAQLRQNILNKQKELEGLTSTAPDVSTPNILPSSDKDASSPDKPKKYGIPKAPRTRINLLEKNDPNRKGGLNNIQKITRNIDAGMEKLDREREAEKIKLARELEQVADAKVKDFISEFKLETLITPEFEALNEPQKLKVVQDLQRRIVDIVKSDAQTEYSESLKNKSLFKSIKSSVTKEKTIKDKEHLIFELLKNTDKGKEIIAEDLKRLTEIAAKQEVFVLEDGNAHVRYLDGLNIPNLTHDEALLLLNDFNQKAFEFTQIPYEWGQEEKSIGIKIGDRRIGKTHKKEFEKAKTKYEKARDEILKIKALREKPNEKGKAMLEVLELDNSVQLEQLLNTHPEFEKALNEFAKSGSGKDVVKNFANTITGKNFTNRLLVAGGFVTRMATISVLGAIAAPVTGGIIGGIRGRIRGKDTLAERQKMARYGKKDESAEAEKFVKADSMVDHLSKIMIELENPDCSETKRAALLKRLKIRIDVAQKKVNEGLMDFGDKKSALENQFKLISSLNKALTISTSLEENTKEEISKRVEKLMSFRSDKIDAEQDSFIREQIAKGVALGVGLAAAGYVVRLVGEHFGWWGGYGTKTTSGNSSEGFRERAENWMKSIFSREEKPVVLEAESLEKKGGATAWADHRMTDDTSVAGETKGGSWADHRIADDVMKDAPGTLPENAEGVVPKEAIIGKGEGIEHALKRQIIANPELGKALEFEKGMNLEKFAGQAAHKVALEHGYVEKFTGEEIRVRGGAGEVAYQMQLDENGEIKIQEFKMKDGKFSVSDDAHEKGSPFEGGQEEKYEYRYSGKKAPALADTTEKTPTPTSAPAETPAPVSEPVAPKAPETAAPIAETAPVETAPKPAAVEATPTPEEVVRADLHKKYEAADNSIRMGSEMRVGTGPTETVYGDGRPIERPAGDNVFYDSQRGTWPQQNVVEGYFFPDLTQKENTILNNILQTHPEFAGNPYGLSGKQLLAVYEIHRENIFHVIPTNTETAWDGIRGSFAKEMLSANLTNPDGSPNSFINYLQKLRAISGVEPKGRIPFIREAEDNEHYIARALQRIVKLGKTGELKASI